MTVLLEIKEKMKSIYAEFAYAITIVLKFVLALLVFFSVNQSIGYLESLQNTFLILILALLGSLLSVKMTVVFAGLLILGHSYALGIEVLAVTAVLFLLLFLLFLRFDEKDGLAVLLTPLALAVGVPVFVPICYGLKGKPASAVSIAGGTITYYYVCMLSEKASVLQNADEENVFDNMAMNLRVLVDGFLKNRIMFLSVAALALTFCVVYLVKKIPLDYIWHIAIGFGAAVYLITMISGGLFLDIEISAAEAVLGTLISVLLAIIMEFFVLNVDYSRTERMEFEDDDYYYYVKAVPKITISQSQREIKTISEEPETVPEIAEEPAEVPEEVQIKEVQIKEVQTEDDSEEKKASKLVEWLKGKLAQFSGWLKKINASMKKKAEEAKAKKSDSEESKKTAETDETEEK